MEALFHENDPFKLFATWYQEALQQPLKEPSQVNLATCDSEGQPNCRVVLLKGFDDDGFYFFTNYNSQKGLELAENPKCCLNFYWDLLTPPKQVKILGTAFKTSREYSQKYWESRPRQSQLSQWASLQSEPVDSRDEMLERLELIEKEFADKKVPCPENWGGYIIKPNYFEFWLADKDRYHDRITFELMGDDWTKGRIYP